MSFISVAAGQPIRATHVQQFTNWLTAIKIDTPGTIAATSTTEYTLTVRSQDGGTGLAFNVLYGSASSPTTIATFNKSQILLASPVRVTGTTPLALAQIATPATGPAVGFSSLYPKTDGTIAYKVGTAATEYVVATTGALFSNPLTTTGDTIFSSSGATAARLPAGTARQGLIMSAGATAPTWAESLQSVLTTQADLIVATAANTPARLAKGTAFQEFVMNAGATGQTWATGVLASAVTAGDTFIATGLNAVARVAKGTAFQEYVMNGGATSATWASGPLALVQTAGDVVVGSTANAMTRVVMGSAGQALVAGSTLPVYEPFPRKNRLINGGMAVKQLATVGTTDNAYGLDGWRLLLEATTCAAVSQGTSAILTGSSHYSAILTVGATNNSKFAHFQPIEGRNMWDLRGQVCSLQMTMQVSNTRIGDVRMAVLQWAGSEDSISTSPVSSWGGATTNPSLIANWSFANTPSTSSNGQLTPTTSAAVYKVENILISATATNLGVLIWCDDKTTTAGDTLTVTDVQLERGAVCTVYERRSYAADLAECQWYFRAFGGASFETIAFGGAQSSSGALVYMSLGNGMRSATPGTSVSALTDWSVVNHAGNSSGTLATLASYTKGTGQHLLTITTTAAPLTTGFSAYMQALNTNARFYLDARL